MVLRFSRDNKCIKGCFEMALLPDIGTIGHDLCVDRWRNQERTKELVKQVKPINPAQRHERTRIRNDDHEDVALVITS